MTVRLLLDTHVALWAIADSPQLPAKARRLILDPDNEIFVSAASVWEISIKHSLGRGNMPIAGAEALQYFRDAGYVLLPISAEHAAAVESLPPHHARKRGRIYFLDRPAGRSFVQTKRAGKISRLVVFYQTA